MPDTQQDALKITHNNHRLFSDYYLNEIVPALPEWDSDAIFEETKAVFKKLQALRAEINPAVLDEAQLEEQWIKPVLDALNHHYSVQVKIRYRERGNRRPDYTFVATEAEAHALTSEIYDPEQIMHVLAVGDAKKWGINLDQSAQGQRNPAQQIDEYLRYSERPWGILTDGRYWRLYHRESSKYNRYYAVDLESLLTGKVEAFQYFYLFFRREAFTTGWLAKVLAGSADFAQKLTDKLEDEVYEALELIAQGFLDYRRNRLKSDPQTLNKIYVESLVLLYRLLFVFYAESRAILPMSQNDAYTRQRSLDSVKKDIAPYLDRNMDRMHPDASTYYTRLRDLFFAIDAGDERLDLPPYNGRLFSDEAHRFLADNVVGDAYLAPALDKLARIEVTEKRTKERVFVDYRDLDVRHLGSIYEKLLEYELDIATEPLTLKSGRYVPAKNPEKALKQKGQVYLRTGSNERKVTGSYYTPDYIVRFIVEKTLEPLLTDITSRYAELDEEGTWHVHDSEALVRDVLALNVLDPATGSGHFVVDVTSYIAEWLTSLSLRPADLGDEDELIYWKRQVAGACIYAIDINPLAVELAKLSMWLTTLAKGKPLSFLNHHIRMGNSLVGASIFEIDPALSSLKKEKSRKKGEKAAEEAESAGQLALFKDEHFTEGVRFAVAQMNEIEGTVADDVSDVKHQEKLYDELTERLSIWQRAADVWAARHFGLELADHFGAAFGEKEWQSIRSASMEEMLPYVRGVVKEAQRIAREQRFFHPELAFPEIFFDAEGNRKENAGFDAVVGNPPYVRQERIQPIKPFLQAHYEVYSGTADLFLYFYERGLQFLKPEHRLGYITSGTYMNSNSAKPFRQYIHEHAGMEWVANFGENQPFRGAEMVYPTIAVVCRDTRRETFRNLFIEDSLPFDDLQEALESGEWVDSLSEATGMDEWRFQSAELTHLFKKIISNAYTTFHQAVNARMYWGIKTGYNEAFYISDYIRSQILQDDEGSAEIIKPLLRGQDLRPWHQQKSNTYVVFTHHGIDIESYPGVKKYLEHYRSRLEPKPKDWTGSWHGRSSGDYAWYELQVTPSYYKEFEQTKIVWPDITKLPRLSFDDDGAYMDGTGFVAVTNKAYLLSLLNSRTLWFALSQVAIPLRLRAGLWQYRAKAQFMERLPIPELTAEQESNLGAIAEEITGLARSRYQMHEDFRQTILNEFEGDEISTRVALYRWWELADERALSDEVKRRFSQEIPLKKRTEWRSFLSDQKSEHDRLTAQIITRETRMNAIVYDAFALTPEERELIETTTKYPYGAV